MIRRWKKLNAPILARITDKKGIRRFWQAGGGYDRNELNGPELYEKITYIHRNPVRAGLADREVDYPWSSIHVYFGDANPLIPIDPIL